MPGVFAVLRFWHREDILEDIQLGQFFSPVTGWGGCQGQRVLFQESTPEGKILQDQRKPLVFQVGILGNKLPACFYLRHTIVKLGPHRQEFSTDGSPSRFFLGRWTQMRRAEP